MSLKLNGFACKWCVGIAILMAPLGIWAGEPEGKGEGGGGAVVEGAAGSGATCRFEVTGQLLVESALKETKGDVLPLEGAELRLRTSAGSPTLVWSSSDRSVTGEGGQVRMVVELPADSKGCAEGQRFQLQARLKSDIVAARSRHATTRLWGKSPWYTVYDTFEGKWEPGLHEIGRMVFRSGSYVDLGRFDARDQADAFQLYTSLHEKLTVDFGGEYGFQNRFAVKTPHNSWVVPDAKHGFALEMNYANPLTQVIYVIHNSRTDSRNLGTYLHEVGHIWAYQHDQGPTGLIWALLTGGTHGRVKTQSVAFHEGFAEYFSGEAKTLLFGAERANLLGRGTLAGTYGMKSVEDLSYRDAGMTYFLRLLSTPDPARIDLETGEISDDGVSDTSGCRDPSLDFKKVLSVFLENEEAGLEPMSKDEMQPAGLMDRWVAAGVLSREDADVYLRLADPSETIQPRDLFCGGDTN